MTSPKTPPTNEDFLKTPELIFFVDALNAVMGIHKELTGQELARLSGVSPQTISAIRNKSIDATLHNIAKIILNMPPEPQDMFFDILSRWQQKKNKSLGEVDTQYLIAVATAQAIQDRLAAA